MFPDTQIIAVSASSFSNQWAVGTDFTHLFAEHRTATGWKQSSPATGIKNDEAIANTLIAATSGQQAWAFAELNTSDSGRVVGVHYNGTTWSAVHAFSGETGLAAAIATGPGDVWQFGVGGPADATPVAYHDTGTAWSKVPIPVGVSQASGTTSAGDWAIGQLPTQPPTVASIEVVHWVKGAWKKVALPTGIAPKGAPALPQGILAVGPANVWAGFAYGSLAGPNPGTRVLLHWNGSRWSTVSLPKGAAAFSLASDGHGGLWTLGGSASSSDSAYHLAGGHWTKVALPTEPGQLTRAGGLKLIPGTQSVIGAGQLDNAKTSAQEYGILRDGP
jgi:hypothetical protein